MSLATPESAYADADTPIASLDAAGAFNELSPQEKRYAYWLTKASWAAADIIRESWTPYGVKLNQLLITLFCSAPGKVADLPQLKSRSGISDADWKALLDYSAQVLAQMANYRTYGHTKFLPRIERAAFEAVVKASRRSQDALKLWSEVADDIYSPTPKAIGKPSLKYLSNWYPDSPDITDEDAAAVVALCSQNGISSLNTRLRKNKPDDFTLLIASTHSQPPKQIKTVLASQSTKLTVRLQYGCFSKELNSVVFAVKQAQKHAANDNQVKMLEHFIESFETGDVDAHQEGSRYWVKDQGPNVEAHLGFVEAYVDPYMARADWEGFVSVVDKTLAARFAAMVEGAEEVIKTMPWGAAFENDVFRKPDYNALTILTFATGWLPNGINIPNYDSVRADTGYKNVALLNTIKARDGSHRTSYLLPEDEAIFKQYSSRQFEVHVAGHEHGSGKILREDAEGKLNFDKSIINPLTGQPVAQWYKPGETPYAKIGSVHAAFEEMRAETAALFLNTNETIMKIFGHHDQDREGIAYTDFLWVSTNGLRALEFYSPDTGKHGQAHMEAWTGILQWLIRDGIAAVHMEHAADGKTVTNAYVTVDKIKVVDGSAKASIARLAVELQVRRAIGDGPGATKFIKELTVPPKEWQGALRDYVIANRTLQKCFVQPNFRLDGDDVKLIDYPATVEGLIASCVERDEGH